MSGPHILKILVNKYMQCLWRLRDDLMKRVRTLSKERERFEEGERERTWVEGGNEWECEESERNRYFERREL